jgi:hypothetical protein
MRIDFNPLRGAPRRVRLGLLAAGVLSVVAAVAIPAQEPLPQFPSESEVSDPPARVGRIALVDGTVSYRPAADTEWGAGDINQPITTGDRLWSDAASRAEVEIGVARIRLWEQTELDILKLDDNTIQIAVPQGSAVLRLSSLESGDITEIDAPNAAVTPDAIGEYRIDVSPDGQTTTVTVWSGSAEVTSAGSSFALAAHQVATIRGDSTTAATYDVAEATSSDDFDEWSTSRDELANRDALDRRYVADDMPGADDLDDSGDWDNDDEYGPVWYPHAVDADWVPYRTGHWVWFGRWGWTWVDDESWGWAPFHYGRWAYIANRWGWCPGRVIAAPVFAPALVVFVGGPSWSPVPAWHEGGGVGWFPLAPGEMYRPAYLVSAPYIQRVNIATVTNTINVVNVTNITHVEYRNRTIPNAIVAVPRGAFESASPVAHSVVHIQPALMDRAPLAVGAPVTPTRASLVAVSSERAVSTPPIALRDRPVVAMHAPPPPAAPFGTQVETIAANGGRPLTAQQIDALRSNAGSAAAVHTLTVHSAAASLPSSKLIAVRPGLPATRPAIQSGTVAHPVARPPTRPPPTVLPSIPPRPPSPEVTASSPGRPARVGPPPPVPRPATRTASAPLAASYAAQREAMETRHVQEFAQPPRNESPTALSARQDAEDQALENRYHQAAAAGRTTMPPAPSSGGKRGT